MSAERELARLDEKMDKALDMLVEHSTMLATISGRLDTYNVQLKDHMRRTEIAEKRLDVLDKKMITALLPVQAIKWVAGAIVGAGALVVAIKAIFGL